MTKVMFTMPWGSEWTYDMPVVPRIGEHVDINETQYLVTAILYYPRTDCVRIRLENL